MIFLIFIAVVTLIVYSFVGMVYFFSLDDKRMLTKTEQTLILNRIKTSNVLFDDDGSGCIPSGSYRHRTLYFTWAPYPFQYYFKEVGWVSWFSPLSKELGKLHKQQKEVQTTKKLREFGLLEEDK